MSDFEIVIFCWLNTSITSAKKIVSKRWRNTLNILYFLPPGTSLQFVSSNISFTQFVLKVSIFLLQLTIFLFKSINNRILDTHNTFIHFLCIDVTTVFLETLFDIFIAFAYTIKFVPIQFLNSVKDELTPLSKSWRSSFTLQVLYYESD